MDNEVMDMAKHKSGPTINMTNQNLDLVRVLF